MALRKRAEKITDLWIFAPEKRAVFSRRVLVSFMWAERERIGTAENFMTEAEIKRKLEAEGFAHTFVWQDGPNAFYPDHTHGDLTAHVILAGEMTLTMGGESKTYGPDDRCDVPAGAVHSARMGPSGCRYVVGEK